MPADGPGVTTDEQSSPPGGDADAGDQPAGAGPPPSPDQPAPSAPPSPSSQPAPGPTPPAARRAASGGNGASAPARDWPDPVSPAGRGGSATAVGDQGLPARATARSPVSEQALPTPATGPSPAREQGLPTAAAAPPSVSEQGLPTRTVEPSPAREQGLPTPAPGSAPAARDTRSSPPVTAPTQPGEGGMPAPGAIPDPGPLPGGEPPPAPVLVPRPDSEPRFRRGRHARPRRTRASKRGLRVTQRLWSISPWSVFKVSALFYLCMGLVILVAGTLLYNAGRSVGTIDQFESFVTRIGAYGECVPTADVPEGTVFEKDPEICDDGEVLVGGFTLDDGTLFRAAAITGGILVVAGSIGNVLLTVLLNLLNELTGGLRHTIIREPVARPSGGVPPGRRPVAARRPGGPPRPAVPPPSGSPRPPLQR